MTMNEPISDIDLNAYVDGELDAQRRIEVEAYLEANPEEAARVMHDMRVRDEIRLFIAGPAVEKAEPEMAAPEPVASPAPAAAQPAVGAGAPLPRRKQWGALWRRPAAELMNRARARAANGSGRGRRAVAALCLVGLGWTAHSAVSSLSVNPVATAHAATHYITIAAQTHQQALHSGIDFKPFADAAQSLVNRLAPANPEVAVPIPQLDIGQAPDGLRTVAWDGGVAVQAAYRHGGSQLITLFASEVDRFAVTEPQAERIGNVSVAYWQVGTTVYALCGEQSEKEILAHARDARMAWF
ncbi:anti-sigma factor RsiW [Azospirillum brasilense]|uniref:Anti-sigma factor RsiW n=2 Tax=Azospirillum brasilense TaxID=192 RepID=A0A560CLC0_AZOBR|nr:anti-sigma factor RsiW [Azospirillum brasilense]